MELGCLLLRVIVCWFGGHGPDGTGQFFEFFEWVGLPPGQRRLIAAPGWLHNPPGAAFATGLPSARAAVDPRRARALRTPARGG
jgi:hypothetical protein